MDAREVFIDRLQSLGRAYSMMTEQEWRGAALRRFSPLRPRLLPIASASTELI